jgi:hypothetical protein
MSLAGAKQSSFPLAIGAALAALCLPLSAKDVPLNAIVLYQASSGAAYVQMSDVLLNGKAEIRVCELGSKIDKSTYGKLPKTPLRGSASLERNADGVLVLTRDQQQTCVVPSNLRFDNKNEVTPSKLADQAVLQGTVLSASDNGSMEIPSLKPGTRLVFVAAADTELAEFLRCQMANSIPVWQQFMSRYASSAHIPEVKKSLAILYQQAAEAAYAQHQKANGPDANLKQARQLAEQASVTIKGYEPAVKLLDQIRVELDGFAETVSAELLAYRKALLGQTSGYAHLAAARHLDDQILDVDPKYSPGLEQQSAVVKEQDALDATLQKSESLLTSKRYDDALLGLGSYRPFAPEVPRINAVVTTVYQYHMDRGKELGSQHWDQAVLEFKKAVQTREDSQEARAALKDAEIQLTNTRNRQAADQAIEQSKNYTEQKEYVEAYEVLANLPDTQRALVADQMEAVKASYVPAAIHRAQTLLEVHIPIRGRADEDAAREAFELLTRASSLSDDPAVRLKRDLLSDKISGYYVTQAKRYLDKPMASGVGLGWCYLNEAQRYKQSVETVRDAMTQYESAYQLRAKLSIGVVIRDQTSRRESVGFADQLADAIDSDLEGSGLPVKVVRQAAGAPLATEPIFLLVGEINEHRIVKNPSLETLQSKYRAGIREVKNEPWLKLNRQYEAAQQDVTKAQHDFESATAQKKKKEIATTKDALATAQQKASDIRSQLDATDQTLAQDVVAPYNYTKTTIDLSGVIDVAFRIVDLNGALIEPTTPLKLESHKVYYVLENVKPEDTEGVKAQNAPPDEGAFMTDLELGARDALIKSIHEKVVRLPGKILDQARKHAQENDLDGAAEFYVIYLNATPETPSSERDEAAKFLRDHFNVSLGKVS